ANGVTLDRTGAVLLAPWRGAQAVVAWEPCTGRFKDVAALDGGGNFDGIEVLGDTIVVASQVDQSLHVIRNGVDKRRIPLPGKPADLGVDTKRGRVLVPYVALDRVDILDFDDLAAP
ncbi:MAG: hypothetical protein AAGD86_09255, partial [Pseudomonadota bacterium]